MCVIHELDNHIEQNDSPDVKDRQKDIQTQISHLPAFSDEILPFGLVSQDNKYGNYMNKNAV